MKFFFRHIGTHTLDFHRRDSKGHLTWRWRQENIFKSSSKCSKGFLSYGRNVIIKKGKEAQKKTVEIREEVVLLSFNHHEVEKITFSFRYEFTLFASTWGILKDIFFETKTRKHFLKPLKSFLNVTECSWCSLGVYEGGKASKESKHKKRL